MKSVWASTQLVTPGRAYDITSSDIQMDHSTEMHSPKPQQRPRKAFNTPALHVSNGILWQLAGNQ